MATVAEATGSSASYKPRRLRIAVLCRHFSSSAGGAERYAVAVAECLAENHDVEVFAQTYDAACTKIRYHLIPQRISRPRWLNQLLFAWHSWLLTRKSFDIVHSHENTWHGNVQTVHVLPVWHNLFSTGSRTRRLINSVKAVTSPRLLAYLWLERMRFFSQDPRAIICVSNPLLTVLHQTFKRLNPTRTSIITPGINQTAGPTSIEHQRWARGQLEMSAEGPWLLFVGRDWVKKGLPALLQALTQLDSRYKLLAVGGSERADSIRSAVEALGLKGRVQIIASLANIDLAYEAADCLVHPTREDTYGMVVLEALSHGLPVIVSKSPYCGISANLRHEQNALLLDDPRSADQISNAVRLVFGDPELRKRLEQQGVRFTREHSWKRVANAYEAIFAGLKQLHLTKSDPS